jgi:hypothetical protein
MAASPSKSQIQSELRRLQKKNPGVEYVILRASNGEVAILPKGKDAYDNPLPEKTAKCIYLSNSMNPKHHQRECPVYIEAQS